MRVLPWLIVGYILLRPRAQPAAAAVPAKPKRAWEQPKAPSVAYMYRLPEDSYETTRLALQQAPDGPIQEMGIFSSPANALSLINDEGWALAWPEVRELKERPQ